MTTSMRNLWMGAGFLALVMVVSVAAYMAVGWTFLESLYMVVITIFSVGYEEVQPVTTSGMRLLTIGVITAGCTGLIFLTGALIQFLTETRIDKVLGIRRMSQEIQKLQNHVIICGYGRIGRQLAGELARANRPFVVIERDTEQVTEAETAHHLVIRGDATDETILRKAGVENAAVLATVLSEDASNVFITLSSRNLNPSLEIIARGEIASTERKLFQAGASRVVLPTHIGAERIAHMILFPHARRFLENDVQTKHLAQELSELGLALEEFVLPEASPFVGEEVAEMERRTDGRFLVVGIHRRTGESLTHPPADTRLHAGDGIVVVCREGTIAEFQTSIDS